MIFDMTVFYIDRIYGSKTGVNRINGILPHSERLLVVIRIWIALGIIVWFNCVKDTSRLILGFT